MLDKYKTVERRIYDPM